MHEEFGENQWLVGVAGESFDNEDGTSRQEIITRCSIGERVQLVREPDNRFDSNAVKVCRENGEQVGYLPHGSAQQLKYDLENDWPIEAEIYGLRGGTHDKPHRGVVLKLTRGTKTFTATSSSSAAAQPAVPGHVERDVREIKHIMAGVVIALVLLLGAWLLWQEAQGVKREQAADAARQGQVNSELAEINARTKAVAADNCTKYSHILHERGWSKKDRDDVLRSCKTAGLKPL